MPLVFTTNEATESGHSYDDRTGESYEYPASSYRRIVTPGERLVYYRGRRTARGRNQPQVYLGVGMVGQISPSASHPGRLVCQILDYQPFETPLPFRSPEGQHLEPGGERGGFYYQPGVRRIPDTVFDDLLRRGLGDGHPDAEAGFADNSGAHLGYAPPTIRLAVDDFAIKAACDSARAAFPEDLVVMQAHNNPGFDIWVGPPDETVRYIEVKGTLAPVPQFYLSEGERLFSESHSDRYTLIVVFNINLRSGAYRLSIHHGAVDKKKFSLRPIQWLGVARDGTIAGAEADAPGVESGS